MSKTILINLSLNELADLIESWGEPAFHAAQVWRWLYRSHAESFEAMSDLPLRLREMLSEKTSLGALTPVSEVASANGQTIKVLFRLADGETIEAVSMQQAGKRHTVCVSNQAGCPIHCSFCATGQQGFRRNLNAGEIVEQVIFFSRRMPDRPVTNVVFMGMGEPLVNYPATVKAIRILNSPHGFNLGARHMTLSTAGFIPGIKRLTREDLQVGLAVSLHAPTDSLRGTLVPLNRRYPLAELIAACRDFFAATGRRVTFEYVLFAGINDSSRHAVQLAKLLAGMNCHVNLIPANLTPGSSFLLCPRERIKAFQGELSRRGVPATIRRSLGADIQAGCGQLRGEMSPAQVE
ncbi:MAG TPA: 23S rRNA (adenine(2503)-C(2))-methyltransferase RlmN [Dehalococcoidia bacterium]|nr:23S rRNA (adenine(2503)-C(2))-methyltransferase RlmN [Dehalococcoidia bacterium]